MSSEKVYDFDNVIMFIEHCQIEIRRNKKIKVDKIRLVLDSAYTNEVENEKEVKHAICFIEIYGNQKLIDSQPFQINCIISDSEIRKPFIQLPIFTTIRNFFAGYISQKTIDELFDQLDFKPKYFSDLNGKPINKLKYIINEWG